MPGPQRSPGGQKTTGIACWRGWHLRLPQAAQQQALASQAAQQLKGPETVLLQGVLMPFQEAYVRKDVLLSEGLISKIADSGSLTSSDGLTINCRERLLLPGFVNLIQITKNH